MQAKYSVSQRVSYCFLKPFYSRLRMLLYLQLEWTRQSTARRTGHNKAGTSRSPRSCASKWRPGTAGGVCEVVGSHWAATYRGRHFDPSSFYNASQCSHCKRCTSYSISVRLSIRPSVTRGYCLKTTAYSTVQFALSNSKMCLVL